MRLSSVQREVSYLGDRETEYVHAAGILRCLETTRLSTVDGYETFCIPPLMSKKTIRIPVKGAWRR